MKSWVDVFSKEDLRQMRRLAYYYVKQGKEESAIVLFEALVLLDPGVVQDDHALGALYVKKGRSEEGLKALDRGLQLDPSYAPSLLNKARALFQLGREEEGFALARFVEGCDDPHIANLAGALIMAFSQDLDDLLGMIHGQRKESFSSTTAPLSMGSGGSRGAWETPRLFATAQVPASRSEKGATCAAPTDGLSATYRGA